MKLPSRFGAAAEKRLAKLTGSRRTPASGARWFAKSDLQSSTHLREVKATVARSYILKLDDLRKNEREAAAANRDSSFLIEFSTAQGRFVYKVERFYGSDT